jgi:hypothetical protein
VPVPIKPCGWFASLVVKFEGWFGRIRIEGVFERRRRGLDDRRRIHRGRVGHDDIDRRAPTVARFAGGENQIVRPLLSAEEKRREAPLFLWAVN